MKSENNSQETFHGLNIGQRLLEKLESLKFTTPTPIQSQAIPVGIEGKDIVGIAQTGTGKTLAFAVPIINRIIQSRSKALIILPTRELAIQVDETFQKLGRSFGINTAVIIGGAYIGHQLKALRQNPQVIIATPGRLVDHLKNNGLKFNDLKFLVLDEADRMFDMGFAPQIKRILEVLPKERQTMLFSATMPDDIAKLAMQYMKDPVRVEVARAGTVAAQIEQAFFMIEKNKKPVFLEKVLNQCKGTILVFSRTKHGAKKICKELQMGGHRVAEIHSNRSLGQRREALEGFKSGKYRVLIATDVASRGIDVTGIELIVNYDIPENPEDYVHRIGRTGRAGLKGRAISFITPDQRSKVYRFERLIKTKLEILKP